MKPVSPNPQERTKKKEESDSKRRDRKTGLCQKGKGGIDLQDQATALSPVMR
jgi:hypothetical protein